MNHKHIVLTAMYRYGILFMSEQPSMEQIKDKLTTTNPHTVIPGSKMLVKKALSDNFGVNNRQDMEQVVSELTHSIWSDGPIYHALIDIFLNDPEAFASLTPEQVEVYLSDDNRISGYMMPFSPAWEQFQLIEDMHQHLDFFKSSVLDFFTSGSFGGLEYLNELFQKNKSWLAYTNGLSMTGFHLSRAVSIIADSHVCGYLTDEETAPLLDFYGSLTEALFRDWESFLSSAILGKQLMSAASGAFIMDSADYVHSCYKLAAHPGRLLEVSGLWVGSDCTALCGQLSKLYGLSLDDAETQVGESDPLLAFVQSTVLPVFRKYGVEYLFDYEMCELEYTVPVADQDSPSFSFMGDFLKRTKHKYDADEIPFMINSKLLITNKNIRFFEKKLLRKKLHTFSWADKLAFTYELTGLDLIAFKVNGITIFKMPRNFKKAGISRTADTFLEKNDVLKHYSEDIQNALRAFSELNDVLQSR
jgi:hypothetical protein